MSHTESADAVRNAAKVVALPGLGPTEAREVAERLAAAARPASHAVLGRELTCTLSAGVSHAPHMAVIVYAIGVGRFAMSRLFRILGLVAIVTYSFIANPRCRLLDEC